VSGGNRTGFCDALKAADYTMLIKYVARNVAKRMGYVVSFMPKPLYDEAGNGMHVHQYLVKNSVNILVVRSYLDCPARHFRTLLVSSLMASL